MYILEDIQLLSHASLLLFIIHDSCTKNTNKEDGKSTILWDMTPCSPLSVNRRSGGIYRLYLQGKKLKIEAICFSKTSVYTQRTTRRYIPEDDTLRNHRCERRWKLTYILTILVHSLFCFIISKKAMFKF
jgi:hypothetical protein